VPVARLAAAQATLVARAGGAAEKSD
jgi:hypothetical protein